MSTQDIQFTNAELSPDSSVNGVCKRLATDADVEILCQQITKCTSIEAIPIAPKNILFSWLQTEKIRRTPNPFVDKIMQFQRDLEQTLKDYNKIKYPISG